MGTIIGSLSRREIKILILCKRNTVHMGSHVTREPQERPNDAIVVLSTWFSPSSDWDCSSGSIKVRCGWDTDHWLPYIVAWYANGGGETCHRVLVGHMPR